MKLPLFLSLTFACAIVLESRADCLLSTRDPYPLPAGATDPRKVAYTSDGAYLAVANFTNGVTLFQVGAGGALSGGTYYPFPAGSAGAGDAVFSPNDEYLAVIAYNSHEVVLYTVGAGLSAGTAYPLPAGATGPFALAFSPNGQNLVVANYQSSNITVFTVGTGTLSGGVNYSVPSVVSCSAVAYSPDDGLFLAVGGREQSSIIGTITIFDVGAGGVLSGGATPYYLPPSSFSPTSIAFSPDGLLLAAANSELDNITVFNVVSGALSGNETSIFACWIYRATISRILT